jgi:hypothetical protein
MLSLLTISAESQTTFAQTEDVVLDPIDIMAYMFDNLSTRVIITARVNNVGDSDITNLRFRVDSLNVDLIGTRVDDESSEGDVVLQDRYTEIVITFPDALEENSTAWVYVEMNVGDLQSEQGLDESGMLDLSQHFRTSHSPQLCLRILPYHTSQFLRFFPLRQQITQMAYL